ncbi:transglutaminase domain-containing protein [bacterium CPR1]|nr:transglutaminase domain-containing protein [bacterium CPR1]
MNGLLHEKVRRLSPRSFYSAQSRMSTPGASSDLYTGVPTDVPRLCATVQGLMAHVLLADWYGCAWPRERCDQVLLRSVRQMLQALLREDARPLTRTRPPERRLLGSCRHYSLLLASILRHQRIPTRLRCGFSAFLRPGQLFDHWALEYLDSSRWVLVDAQLDEVHRHRLKLDFPCYDVPRSQQLQAGQVWQECRRGRLDPDRCGALSLWGMDYVKANLLRDVASLLKREMLPWDGPALALRPFHSLDGATLRRLDQLAELTYPEVQLEELRRVYALWPELHIGPLPNPHRY